MDDGISLLEIEDHQWVDMCMGHPRPKACSHMNCTSTHEMAVVEFGARCSGALTHRAVAGAERGRGLARVTGPRGCV
ncbi:hypothetical protein EVAR_88261_1 [Eumeta japonica]|uniref:Uncharacterized protein n=1 Tax=Eumeta variegata TaxID=151549 RepID=A0A4C1XQ50_EUMVA|nr:hypothetical protein EVAR_88261_1 [Eumeta japonica]